MNNLPTLYISLIIFFFGIAAYASLQYAYIYKKIPYKLTLPPLVFSLVAFLYMLCDLLAIFFTFIIPVNEMARLFVILRELVPLLFLIIAPYFIDQSLTLKPEVKKINRILLWAGTALSGVITAFTAFRPDLMITGINQGNSGYYAGILYQENIGPLLLIKNIIVILYMLYTVAIILFSKIHGKNFQIKNTIIGLTLLCYFALTYLYFLLFTSNQTGFGNIVYPHFALGIILFIVFMNFGATDMFIGYNNQMITVKKELNHILYYDAMLGIPNRISFIKDLQSELKAEGASFSLIFMDIDDFKNLNEHFGESVGNEILKMLSQRLNQYFARAGTLYRIGGDEFVFLCKEATSEEETKSLAGKIISSLRNSFSVSGKPYLVTASLGILQIPKDGRDEENILGNARSAINRAKKMKNTYVVFTRELMDGSAEKIHIVNLLRESMERDQFTLLYQPVLDINKKLVHAESLLRCTNADPSISGPGKFIPLIEEAGLINEVDNMVVRKAFHDMEMRIKKRFNISINLSTNQLINPAYSVFLSSFSRQHGIENRQVILEVTENSLMKNMSLARENLLELKNSGFSIAIDDFGTGFSSLTYLAELPVDMIKMDMAFVQSVPGNSKKEAMARHIIDLAHSLKLKVVAEGFERLEQFDFFKSLGCDLFQGYYFSFPLPLDELLAKYLDKL
jgi:diguanylate cyclase (GGDEF)-like protein